MDGVDLATVRLDSYRRHLGVVLQETFLFDGTIRENVAFSRPAAGEEEILEACRIAHVGEFAEGFADGYDTVVGERGVRLSGGQRQRVAIARAILADPRILILDEATSSLDSESEALIQEGLSWLMKGRTTFVIAHRLSTIRRADQILVVEKGRIVERGTHARAATRRAGATARCTTGSTGWRRTSSSRRARETRWRRSRRRPAAPASAGASVPPGAPRPVSAPSPFQDAVVLAPLTVGGNLPFRRLCTELGADVTVGEMAVVRKLLGGSSSEFALLKSHPDEPIFGVQLADKRAETLVEGARLAESRGARFVDLNCGCPIDQITRRGLGASLLRKPTKVGRLVAAMKAAVSIPVTVKLRAGWHEDKINVSDVARACEENGADAIAIHGRTREQRYSKAADWDLVGKVAAERGVPVIGNGDILTPYEARERRTRSGVRSVMLGRGALIKPWLFREIKEGRDWLPTPEERFGVLWRFVELQREHFGADERGVKRTMRFLPWHLNFFCRYVPLPEAAVRRAGARAPAAAVAHPGAAARRLPSRGCSATPARKRTRSWPRSCWPRRRETKPASGRCVWPSRSRLTTTAASCGCRPPRWLAESVVALRAPPESVVILRSSARVGRRRIRYP